MLDYALLIIYLAQTSAYSVNLPLPSPINIYYIGLLKLRFTFSIGILYYKFSLQFFLKEFKNQFEQVERNGGKESRNETFFHNKERIETVNCYRYLVAQSHQIYPE